MFLSNILPRLLSATSLILTQALVEAEQEGKCCPMKMVGSTSYSLLPDQALHGGDLPHQCLDGCVYTVTGTTGPKFCFQKGSRFHHIVGLEEDSFKRAHKAVL